MMKSTLDKMAPYKSITHLVYCIIKRHQTAFSRSNLLENINTQLKICKFETSQLEVGLLSNIEQD